MHEFITLTEKFGEHPPGSVLRVLRPGEDLAPDAVDPAKAASLVDQHRRATWGKPVEASEQVAAPVPRRRAKHA